MYRRGKSSLHALCGYSERIGREKKRTDNGAGIFSREVVRSFFNYGFSQLSTSEFLKREMEMHETKIHLLCGWSQIVIQKNTFPLQ